jgi:hypothetical protein
MGRLFTKVYKPSKQKVVGLVVLLKLAEEPI